MILLLQRPPGVASTVPSSGGRLAGRLLRRRARNEPHLGEHHNDHEGSAPYAQDSHPHHSEVAVFSFKRHQTLALGHPLTLWKAPRRIVGSGRVAANAFQPPHREHVQSVEDFALREVHRQTERIS